MVRDALRGAAVTALVVQATACLGFELVGPEARAPTGGGTIRITEHELVSGIAQFVLSPGTDATGSLRSVADPSLLVNLRPLTPTTFHRDGRFEYEASLNAAQLDGDWLDIRFPSIDGSQPSIRVPLTVRGGHREIDLSSEADLVLPVRTPANFDASAGVRWNLRLREKCNSGITYAQVLGNGAPSDAIVIPPSLQGDATGQFEACLEIIYQSVTDTPSYRIAITTQTEMSWLITFTDDLNESQ